MECTLDPSLDWSSRPGPAPSPLMVTERPGGQPPTDPVLPHGHEGPYRTPSSPMNTERPGGQPPTDPVLPHGHEGPYRTPSSPMNTEGPSSQPPTDPVLPHGHEGPYRTPSSPMNTEGPGSQPPTDPVLPHGYEGPYRTPSSPMNTEGPGSQPLHMPTDRKVQHKLDVELFRRVNSLIRHERIVELLELTKINRSEEGRQPLNLIDDPVLSVVISARKTHLAVELIERVENAKLREANIFGDTPLHIAAIEGDTNVAKVLLWKEPGLMKAVNKKEETALHKAAMYGHESMFWCLVQESKGVNVLNYRKGDGSNVLHCAIMGNAPRLALDIARRDTDRELILSRDAAAVTPLQLMVTIPNFFRSQLEVGPLESLLYKLVTTKDSQSKNVIADEEAGRPIDGGAAPTDKDEDYYGWKWKSVVRSKFPSQYNTVLDLIELIASWLRLAAFKILKQFSATVKDLEKQKKRYAAAMQLVEHLAKDKDYDFYCKGYSKGSQRNSTDSTSPDSTSSDAMRSPSDREHASSTHSTSPDSTSSDAMRNPSDPAYASGENTQEDDDATETKAPAEKMREILKEALDRLTQTPTPISWTEPPLIIAAERGLHDFVRKILQVCPQSATYLDSNGRNVLQVAILSGRKEVVSVLSEMLQGSNPILPAWLCTMLDSKRTSNTILHLAAEHSPAEEGDAVQLHHELKWFEMVEKIVPKELVHSRNKAEKTAHKLFTEKHEKTLQNCKKQLVDTGKTCSPLLAAVVLASSFSIPGDKNKASGSLALTIFSHAYVIGFGCAATALLLFLSFVITPYKERYFRRVIPMQYFFACLSFALALVAFLVSFVCNFVQQVYGGHKMQTTYLITLFLELLLFLVICIAVLLYHGAKLGPSFIHFWK